MNKLTLCLLSLAVPLLVLAQEPVDETEEDEIRRFTVEVIIFRYAQNVGVGNEVFVPDAPQEPVAVDAIDEEPVIAAAPLGDPDGESEPRPDIELVLLEEDRYRLQETYGRLERLEVYEPLMHFGWTQAAWPTDQTEALPLHLFARPPEGLDGTLKLYLGRYLHLVADLQLEAPDGVTERSPSQSGFDGHRLSADDSVEAIPRRVFYRINEDRILRGGEVRYYDHPKFGVLATVRRVEEDADPEPGELLGYPVQ